jgi:hypothetical protein
LTELSFVLIADNRETTTSAWSFFSVVRSKLLFEGLLLEGLLLFAELDIVALGVFVVTVLPFEDGVICLVEWELGEPLVGCLEDWFKREDDDDDDWVCFRFVDWLLTLLWLLILLLLLLLRLLLLLILFDESWCCCCLREVKEELFEFVEEDNVDGDVDILRELKEEEEVEEDFEGVLTTLALTLVVLVVDTIEGLVIDDKFLLISDSEATECLYWPINNNNTRCSYHQSISISYLKNSADHFLGGWVGNFGIIVLWLWNDEKPALRTITGVTTVSSLSSLSMTLPPTPLFLFSSSVSTLGEEEILSEVVEKEVEGSFRFSLPLPSFAAEWELLEDTNSRSGTDSSGSNNNFRDNFTMPAVGSTCVTYVYIM